MTTRNETVDHTTVVATEAGPGNVGIYYTSSRSGVNQVNLVPPKGISTNRVWVRPLKRARLGEHSYTMSYSMYSDSESSYNDAVGLLNADGTKSSQDRWHTCTTRNMGFGASATSTWTSNDSLKLIGKLREQVAGSSFNAAVAMAEGKQSLETIASAAKRIASAYAYVHKGNMREATRALTGHPRGPSSSPNRTFGSNWLEVQYGWLPLLNDIYDAAQSLAHLTSVPLQQVIRVSRRVPMKVKSTSWMGFSNSSGFEGESIKCILKEVNVVQLLGLTDPASVVWEKVPYSFVADWFLPIGQFLAARGLSQALTGTFVTSHIIKWDAAGPIVTNPGITPGRVYGYRAGEYRARFVSLTRTVSTTLQVPLPSVVPLKQAMSWRHAANAIALVTQVVAGIGR